MNRMRILLMSAMLLIMGGTVVPLELFASTSKKVSTTDYQDDKKREKEFKEEAERLEKEGWKPVPGERSIVAQLERCAKLEDEMDEEYLPKFVNYTAMSPGEIFDVAMMTAEAIARQGLGSKISSEMRGVVENKITNNPKNNGKTESMLKIVAECTAKYHQRIGRIITPMRLYRNLDNGNVEVLIRAFYDSGRGEKEYEKFIETTLKDEGYDYVPALNEQ